MATSRNTRGKLYVGTTGVPIIWRPKDSNDNPVSLAGGVVTVTLSLNGVRSEKACTINLNNNTATYIFQSGDLATDGMLHIQFVLVNESAGINVSSEVHVEEIFERL